MKSSIALLFVVLGALLPARPADPQRQANGAQQLDAQAARNKGWRAAFLEYFAEDSIALTPDPVPARDRVRSRPVRPFSEEELTWEPKAGDVADSNDIGWLTGPSAFIDHTAAQPAPSHGNYLSIWKKQKDGEWRVYIDIGTAVPSAVPFPTWFTHVTAVPRFKGRGDASGAASLLNADREANAALQAADGPKQYLSRIVEHARLHRAGTTPAVSIGSDEIARWFASNPGTMAATTTAGEAAASGELGYAYGKYDTSGAAPQHGAYARIWSRDGNGRWRIAADVTAPVR
jgi:ketosteroid isomerase-like protein